MPTFTIHVVNSDFDSREPIEAASIDDARTHGLRAALTIGADEVCKGEKPFFGAEVRIEAEGEVKQRFMVGIGQSPLQSP